jgi:hypothetical protein
MKVINLGPDLDHGHRVVLKGDGIVVNINCVDAQQAAAAAFNANWLYVCDSIDIVAF